jgi:hypothetical protein
LTLKKDYKLYRKEDFPDAKINIVSTRHGKMLKIFIPNLEKNFFLHAESVSGASKKESIFISGNPRHRYCLNPRMQAEKTKYGSLSQTMIYTSGKGGSGFILGMRYDVSDRTPTFPFIGTHPYGGDLICFVGTKKPSLQITAAPEEVIIDKFGWQKIPVSEVEYGSQND